MGSLWSPSERFTNLSRGRFATIHQPSPWTKRTARIGDRRAHSVLPSQLFLVRLWLTFRHALCHLLQRLELLTLDFLRRYWFQWSFLLHLRCALENTQLLILDLNTVALLSRLALVGLREVSSDLTSTTFDLVLTIRSIYILLHLWNVSFLGRLLTCLVMGNSFAHILNASRFFGLWHPITVVACEADFVIFCDCWGTLIHSLNRGNRWFRKVSCPLLNHRLWVDTCLFVWEWCIHFIRVVEQSFISFLWRPCRWSSWGSSWWAWVDSFLLLFYEFSGLWHAQLVHPDVWLSRSWTQIHCRLDAFFELGLLFIKHVSTIRLWWLNASSKLFHVLQWNRSILGFLLKFVQIRLFLTDLKHFHMFVDWGLSCIEFWVFCLGSAWNFA